MTSDAQGLAVPAAGTRPGAPQANARTATKATPTARRTAPEPNRWKRFYQLYEQATFCGLAANGISELRRVTPILNLRSGPEAPARGSRNQVARPGTGA